jgi:di/tricarboxylate transporter
MDWQGWLTLALIGGAVSTLVFTRAATDLVMMTALVLLGVTGVLTPAEALTGFSNNGVVTVAAMFVIAAGIRISGGVDLVVNHVLGQPTTRRGALTRLSLPVIVLSGFLNNTPVVATMIPAVTRWARQIERPTSALMIPLSYASILGGLLTLIGTSTNLVVNGQYQALTGEAGFHLFEITWIGVPLILIGLAFIVLVLPRLLPQRPSPRETFADTRRYTFEVAVAENGPLVGKSILEAGLRNLKRIYLAEIERQGGVISAVSPEERLQGGDRLVFVGDTDAIMDVLRVNGLVPSRDQDEAPALERTAPERKLVEVVVSPHCEGLGRSIRDSRFRDRYGAVILAVARNGEHIRGNLGSIRLQTGDVLLLEARPSFVTRQQHARDFLLISELDHDTPDHSRAPVSWLILGGVVLCAATGLIPMVYAALAGAGAMVLTGCCTANDARRSLDISVLVTIAASFALGVALQKTGAAGLIADTALSLSGGHPWALLALTYIAVWLFTEIITNNAAAILMLPVVLASTTALGLNHTPYVMTLMVAASASFATPLGYQTNLMVYGPGGYHFNDFLRAGLPMNLLIGLATVLLVPLIWPLAA